MFGDDSRNVGRWDGQEEGDVVGVVPVETVEVVDVNMSPRRPRNAVARS